MAEERPRRRVRPDVEGRRVRLPSTQPLVGIGLVAAAAVALWIVAAVMAFVVALVF